MLNKIKTTKVNNAKNVVVQIPTHIVKAWGISEGDSVDMLINEETGEIVLKPRKGYYYVKPAQNI